MSQVAPAPKTKRLIALCSDEVHREFFELVDRSGESAGVILRGLVADAITRGRRGEPLVPRLGAGTPSATAGG